MIPRRKFLLWNFTLLAKVLLCGRLAFADALDDAASLSTPEARAHYACTRTGILTNLDQGRSHWRNGLSSCLRTLTNFGKTVREYTLESFDLFEDGIIDHFPEGYPSVELAKSQAMCFMYKQTTPELYASMGCLYLHEIWEAARQRAKSIWLQRREKFLQEQERLKHCIGQDCLKSSASINNNNETTSKQDVKSAQQHSRKTRGGACTPVDEKGRACII